MVQIRQVEIPEDKKIWNMLRDEFLAYLKTELPPYKDLQQTPKSVHPIVPKLIANYKGMDVGCVGLRKESVEVCEMLMLYIKDKKKLRGKGIGRKLAEAIIEHARQMGYRCMRLDTIEPLHEAKQLYKSLGFKRIDYYHECPVELKKLAICMELKLV